MPKINIEKIIPISIVVAAFSVFYFSCAKDTGKLPSLPITSQTFCDSLGVRFSTDINPIIQTNCVNPGCHFAGGGSSGTDISSYSLIDTARIRARVLDGNPSYMPQAGILPLLERQKIECWLKTGAPNN